MDKKYFWLQVFGVTASCLIVKKIQEHAQHKRLINQLRSTNAMRSKQWWETL